MATDPRSEWLLQEGGLARRLRALREGSKSTFPTAKAFADAAGFHEAQVSKAERGLAIPTDETIRLWVAGAGGTGTQADELVALAAKGRALWAGKRRVKRGGLAAAQKRVDELIAGAARIATFEPILIPGPLQTPGYAQAVIPTLLEEPPDPDDLAQAVAARQQRWAALYNPAKLFEVVFVESALRLWPGPAGGAVMRRQIEHIRGLLTLENLQLGIIPFDRCLTVYPTIPVAIYDHDVAMIETPTGSEAFSGEDVEVYDRWLARLWTQADTDPDEVAAILDRAAEATS